MVRGLIRGAYRSGVLVVGAALIAVGLALLVLPGPGLLVVLLGMTVLASEFVWARRGLSALHNRVRERAERLRHRHSME